MPVAEKTDTLRLLIVSKEPSVLRPLWTIGESNSWRLETVGSGWDALERVQSGIVPHLLLLDLPRGDEDTLHVLRWLRRLRADLPIIVLAYPDDAGQKREALRLGAQDYLIRPVDEKQLESSIRRHLDLTSDKPEAEITSDDIEQLSDGAFFIGASPIMQKLRAQAALLAEADVPVLILGEAGSGKDTAARLIHKLSVRSGCKFLKVNCAALPEDLLESELFGSERGAPGTRPRIGKLEACNKGTILLDEIAEMPTRLQALLLQMLQEKQFIRPGGQSQVAVDVRILAATSASIERAIAERKLREDLYYRLSAFTLHVPPLRQRREEIPLLLQHLMHHLAKHYTMTPRVFSAAVLNACQSYAWPGNLKELESFVKRYLVMGEKEMSPGVDEADAELSGETGEPSQKGNRNLVSTDSRGNASGTSSLKSLVQTVKLEAERNAIAAALEKTGWNRKAAARLLRVSYRTLLYKIEQYHMRSPEGYSSPYLGNGYRNNGNGFKSNGKVS